jgi:hypothetical protein
MAWAFEGDLTAALMNEYLPQAWTTYTPTLTGTGTTQGNATMTGGLIQYGKTTHGWARAVLGSTTVIGSALILSLPATARSAAEGWGPTNVTFIDVGGSPGAYVGGLVKGTTGLTVYPLNSAGGFINPSSTVPFTWVTGDEIYVGYTYESAA